MSESGTTGLAVQTVDSLIARFLERDVCVRQRARLALEELGPAAVDGLVRALRHPLDRVRWESAKALGTIADPGSAPALVRLLRDHSTGVRWLAAEALVAIGRPALRPLLEALVRQPGALELREGAHHVLHDLLPRDSFGIVAPVLAALEHPAPELEAPVAASQLLDRLSADAV
jgi:HEAT repeat protein